MSNILFDYKCNNRHFKGLIRLELSPSHYDFIMDLGCKHLFKHIFDMVNTHGYAAAEAALFAKVLELKGPVTQKKPGRTRLRTGRTAKKSVVLQRIKDALRRHNKPYEHITDPFQYLKDVAEKLADGDKEKYKKIRIDLFEKYQKERDDDRC
jgi:hypothetical protein